MSASVNEKWLSDFWDVIVARIPSSVSQCEKMLSDLTPAEISDLLRKHNTEINEFIIYLFRSPLSKRDSKILDGINPLLLALFWERCKQVGESLITMEDSKCSTLALQRNLFAPALYALLVFNPFEN